MWSVAYRKEGSIVVTHCDMDNERDAKALFNDLSECAMVCHVVVTYDDMLIAEYDSYRSALAEIQFSCDQLLAAA